MSATWPIDEHEPYTAQLRSVRVASGRCGFTLFEIAISLVLVSFGVISILILFPMGIKAQENARFRIYAAAKALEIVESYNASHNANPAFEAEAPNAWDVHVTGRNLAPDLEARDSSYRFGMFPLPLTIAQRLDSDGDEIQTILSQGGYLYYSQPLATTGLSESGFTGANTQPPNDAQRLVMGIVGYAQNNALYAFPWKAWPYYAAYPSPPAFGNHQQSGWLPISAFKLPVSLPNMEHPSYLWEDTTDPDIRMVWSNIWPVPAFPTGAIPATYGGYYWHWLAQPYVPPTVQAPAPSPSPTVNPPNQPMASLQTATNYLACALWYATRKGLPLAFINGTAGMADVQGLFAQPPANLAQQVCALRFLAHAATTVSGYSSNPNGEPINPLAMTAGGISPAMRLTSAMITDYHEMCLAVGMRFAASYPYDWGAPRPLQRAIMTDNPLIEFDLLQPGNLLSGQTYAGGYQAQAWRPIAAQPIRNLGVSFTYPAWNLGAQGGNTLVSENPLDAGYVSFPQNPLWGDGEHDFTLTQHFAPAERCRQIVFWTVDWQSYEDCETAPSAPVDAGKYLLGAPVEGGNLNWAMTNPPFMDWQQFGYFNPEKVMVFTSSCLDLPTGSHVATEGTHDQANQGLGNAAIFNGLYGADRNANGLLDRGPVPTSVRLRAVQVGRFNYYDLRVPATIR